MGKHKHSKESGGGHRKEFYIRFSVQRESDGIPVDGIFGYQSWGARKALLDARQQVDRLRDQIPSGYRSSTAELFQQVYTDRSQALASIGITDEHKMDGKLLIEVR
ncbi:MAG: hypothetical protein JXC85_05355 [Candidatus Aenigmarchaeota archaeon]|nr:hypothetical protein [Candidatus Aenigmarchaeota archaeon]